MSEINNNQHIEKYLNWYLDPLKNKSPDFAVLITGDWGSGKTTFIKNFLKYKTPIVDNLTGKETLVIYDHQLPLLSFIDPIAFVDAYIQIEGEKKQLIFKALEKRYITPEFSKFLLSEKEFLEKVLKESKRRKNESEFAPSTYALKFLIEVCEKAIENLNKVKEN
jgi:septin family protein